MSEMEGWQSQVEVKGYYLQEYFFIIFLIGGSLLKHADFLSLNSARGNKLPQCTHTQKLSLSDVAGQKSVTIPRADVCIPRWQSVNPYQVLRWLQPWATVWPATDWTPPPLSAKQLRLLPLEQRSPPFLMLQPFRTVPHVVLTPNQWIILVATS